MTFSHPCILCVDDDPDSYELMRHLLNCVEENYDLTTNSSAASILNLITAQWFDLYILDYQLREANGIEICRQIRRINAATPILFFTGMARAIDRETAMTAGASEYLIKPNDLDRLAETVKRLVGKSSPLSLSV